MFKLYIDTVLYITVQLSNHSKFTTVTIFGRVDAVELCRQSPLLSEGNS